MADEPGLGTQTGVELEVGRARGLLAKSAFAEALEAGRELRLRVPENRDVLYLIVVSLRYLGRLDEALAVLAEFEALHPGYGRLFQERGHCYRALGDTERALAAYRRAVELNGALPASWRAIAELYKTTGRAEEAATAASVAAHVATLPTAIVTATSLFAEGEVFAAENIVRKYLQDHGHHIEAMRLLAQIGMKLDVLDDAELLLESVLLIAPDYHAARYEYASVLARRHKHAKALDEANRLLAVEPDNRAFRTLRANCHVGLGEHELALERFRELLVGSPVSADIHLSIGHALKTIGKQSAAIDSYRNAAAARADFGDAYWSLANLKTYEFTDEELDRMRQQEARADIAPGDRYHFCFALGKALEDRGSYEESFAYYERGNALKKTETVYRHETMERVYAEQESVCTTEFFAARRGAGHPSTEPIFIVGLPRSGSTLLEQILAAHSQVEGTMELAEIPRLAAHLAGRETRNQHSRYPSILRDTPIEDFYRFGTEFLEGTRILRSGRPFFIDKMPNNFRHIGLIHLMLPNARIIDARRNPMDCCFSNFKQLFATGQEFTYGLEDIARYYNSYVRLMNHWSTVLPGKVLLVRNEDVIDDLEGTVRRMLDFLGLGFEPACLEFHRSDRAIRTASSEQVRRPINRDGLGQWKHFEPWLGPLRDALDPRLLE